MGLTARPMGTSGAGKGRRGLRMKSFLKPIEFLGLTVLGLAGMAAWGVGVVFQEYNYDEMLRAHSVWLTARGFRPYHDFFECHPPLTSPC